jgi:hypothetical protein
VSSSSEFRFSIFMQMSSYVIKIGIQSLPPNSRPPMKDTIPHVLQKIVWSGAKLRGTCGFNACLPAQDLLRGALWIFFYVVQYQIVARVWVRRRGVSRSEKNKTVDPASNLNLWLGPWLRKAHNCSEHHFKTLFHIQFFIMSTGDYKGECKQDGRTKTVAFLGA